ncbi:MAG: 30S ribosomal protein S2, partial [bacterium]
MGGTLTNFKTLKKNIARLNEIEKMKEDGTLALLPKKEVILIGREHRKLERGLGGIRQMNSLPAVVFVVDTQKEQTAIKEARKLKIPIIGVVDTNTDPEEVDYPVPGNDDAIRSIKLLARIFAEAVLAGREATKQLNQAEAEGADIAVPAEGEELATPVEEPEEAIVLSEEERLEAIANIKIKEEEEEEK